MCKDRPCHHRWRKELEEETGLEQVELAPALADIMAVKDPTEQVPHASRRGHMQRPPPCSLPSSNQPPTQRLGLIRESTLHRRRA